MTTPETTLRNQVVRWLNELRRYGDPVWYVKLHGGPQQRRGLPDFLIVFDGRCIFIELKAAAGKVTRLQQHTMDQIKAAGGEAVVCRTLADVISAIEGGKL